MPSPRLSKSLSKTIAPAACTAGAGEIFAAENPFSEQHPCSFAPGNLKDFSKNW